MFWLSAWIGIRGRFDSTNLRLPCAGRPEWKYEMIENRELNVDDYLAMFRRRSLTAEGQLKESGHTPKGRGSALGERLAELETENVALKARIEGAEERMRQMADRVRFLRQQLQMSSSAAGAGRS